MLSNARAVTRAYPNNWFINLKGQEIRSNRKLAHWFEVSQWQQRLHRLARRIVSIEQLAHQAAAQGRGEEVRIAREESGLMTEPKAMLENDNEHERDETDVES